MHSRWFTLFLFVVRRRGNEHGNRPTLYYRQFDHFGAALRRANAGEHLFREDELTSHPLEDPRVEPRETSERRCSETTRRGVPDPIVPSLRMGRREAIKARSARMDPQIEIRSTRLRVTFLSRRS